MPMWERLPEKDQVAIVELLKSFSDIFEDEEAKEPPIEIKTPPPLSQERIIAGEKVYEEMGCADCHGPGGQGDGPSALTLKDDRGRPIRPYDFTSGPGLMKGGNSLEDIYRTFMTGLDGTPMPSYGDSLEEDERWQLVSFVQSLSASSPGTILPPMGILTLNGVETATDPSLDLDDPIWGKAPATIVPLRPLWARDRWVDFVTVQIAVGPKVAAFRFEWRDVQKDDDVVGPKTFRDAVALQFVPEGSPSDYIGIPFIGMGDEENSVTIWHWKADWEADIAAGFRDAVQNHEAAMDKMVRHADLTVEELRLTGLAAGNPLSIRTRESPVEALVANGFGTLTSLPKADQTVTGRGTWRNGVWVAVMRQPLDSAGAPPLRKRKSVPVAVAVWDGAAGDRNGQKAVSQWMELILEPYGEIKYVGSSAVGRFMNEAAGIYKQAAFDIDTSLESGGGENAIAAGKSDLGGVAREVDPRILSKGVKKFLIGRDAVGIWVNAKNPVTELSFAQLRGIFTGKIVNWKEVGGRDLPINVYVVNPQSATRSVFRIVVLGSEDYAGNRIQTVRPDPAILGKVATDEGGIGQLSFALGSKAKGVKRINPNGQPASVDNSSYPITRPLYLITKGEPEGATQAFIDWALSEEGQAVVKKHFVGR